MSGFAFLVGGVFFYLTVLIFLGGMGYRFYQWFKTPQPGKMTVFPRGSGSTGKEVLAEILFFPSLFKGDRVLWFFSWVFHITLYLVFLGHIRVFTSLIDRVLVAMGLSSEGVDWMSSTFGGVAGIVLLATGVLLLVRRSTVQRVREISGVPDFFALLLIIAIIATGDVMRFGEHFDLTTTRHWALSLLTFSPVVPQNGVFLIHLLFAQLLIIYIPFSKILHFGGIFFTQALVKRR